MDLQRNPFRTVSAFPLHHRLTRRAAWIEYDGELPIIEGTLNRLTVEHLPGDARPKPVWL
ncbi:hypothetical protein [Nonomuraea diastatica]|uniref:hypothetical protein n=1 Tax=Nonomuraea diastatica TaxID=1848329 RepID=UPI0015F2BA5C|nr:hypothetical protein [Nonomuraea diastatica]